MILLKLCKPGDGMTDIVELVDPDGVCILAPADGWTECFDDGDQPSVEPYFPQQDDAEE